MFCSATFIFVCGHHRRMNPTTPFFDPSRRFGSTHVYPPSRAVCHSKPIAECSASTQCKFSSPFIAAVIFAQKSETSPQPNVGSDEEKQHIRRVIFERGLAGACRVKIQRANLDGTGVENLITTGIVGVQRIAVDQTGGKMYWAD